MQKNEQIPASKPKWGGDSIIYMSKRLKDQRPDLHKQVEAGELSVNAAAIKAGWRKPKMTIMIDTPDNAVRYLLKRFSKTEIRGALKRAP